jgi:hypothetical protein
MTQMKFFPQQPKKILTGLGLYSNEIKDLLEKLTGKTDWITYKDSKDNPIDIQILKLGKKRYFAFINCEGLCGIENKHLFIKDAVERAIKQKKLSISFKNIAVGGLVSDEGRLGFLSKLIGETPPAVHEYAAFKLPGEDYVCIEDPRTGIFDTTEKLQSRIDNQVCCFAASAIFYFCYKTLQKGNTTKSTRELFAEIYSSSKLRSLIQSLEKKVGHSVETKEQVIDSFVKKLLKFENPISELKKDKEERKEPAGLTI